MKRMTYVGCAVIAAGILAANAYGQTREAAGPAEDQLNPEAQARDSALNQRAAESLLARREAAAGRVLDRAYRASLSKRLASLPLSQLEAASSNDAQVDLTALLGGGVTNLLGDSSADLVYTPVTPCRVFDTRTGGGPIAAGTARNFVVAGPGTSCGIPFGPATSIIINFASVNPAGPGNLRAWAVATPQPAQPLASVLNYGVVAGLPALANGIAVPICDLAVTACPADLRLQANGSATDVVGDVVGYFRKFAGPGGSSVPIAYGFINSDGTVSSATSNVTSLYDAALGRYQITIAGENYFLTQYVTVVTPTSNDLIPRTNSVGGNLLVYLRTTGGVAAQASFQFVTFQP